MPPAVLVGALVAGGLGALGGALGLTTLTIFGLSATLSGFLVGFATSLILGTLQSLLTSKPKTQAPTGSTQSVREPLGTHKIIVGQVRAGGSLTFADCLDGNTSLHLVVTLSARPIESISAIYFNQSIIDYGPDHISLASALNAAPNFAGGTACYIGTGTVPGDAPLIAAIGTSFGLSSLHGPYTSSGSTNWTSSMFQYQRAKLYFRLAFNGAFQAGGIPNLTAIVRGLQVYDPRNAGIALTSSAAAAPGIFTTGVSHAFVAGDHVWIRNHAGATPAIDQEYEIGTAPGASTFTLLGADSQPLTLTIGGAGGTVTKMLWTDNPALIVAYYLCDPIHGLKAVYANEIDEPALIQAANDCDGIVARGQLPSFTFTANFNTSLLTLGSAPDSLVSGTQCTVSSSGALPTGLLANTVYYVIDISSNSVKLALTVADCLAGLASATFTDNGSGTMSLQVRLAFTADATSDRLTLGGQSQGGPQLAQQVGSSAARILTGTQVKVSTTGTLPGNLSAGTTYYAGFLDPYRLKLASSLANARLGIFIDVTTAGTGTHFIDVFGEPRYTCNGIIDTGIAPQDILNTLLSTMAGYAVFSGGLWSLYAGVWRSGTVTLDESDLRGPIEVQSLISGQQAFNQVKGTFPDPWALWQPTDLPPVVNSTYVTADNGEIDWNDVQLPFTTSAVMGQRLLKIMLERMRQELTVTLQLKLTAFPVRVPDVFMLDNTLWGWSGKNFEAQAWQLKQEDNNGVPMLGVDIVGRETDSSVFDWNSNEETHVDHAPNTNLPNPFNVAAPANLTLDSGTDVLAIRLDGTIFSRIEVSWDAITDVFITAGGSVEVQFKLSSVSTWSKAAPVPGDQTFTFILDVTDGALYDVRARSINNLGVASDTTDPWQSTIKNYAVIGKTQPPSDAPSLIVKQNGVSVILSAGPITDLDTAAAEFRYGSGGVNWASATFIEAPAAQRTLTGAYSASFTTAAIPTGTWTFLVKYRDTTGNYSANAATATLQVTAAGAATVASSPQAPDWPGLHPNVSPPSSSGFLLHYLGYLVPESTKAASAHTDQELFEKFVPFPVAQCTYEATELDFGSDTTARFSASPLVVANGRGVVGTVVYEMDVDYWLSAGSDTGVFALWVNGQLSARYVRSRVAMTPGSVPGIVTDFTPFADKQVVTQNGTPITVAAGGTVITFPTPYHSVPLVQCIPTGANVGWVDNVTATTAKLHVGPDTTHDNGGTAGWMSIGV